MNELHALAPLVRKLSTHVRLSQGDEEAIQSLPFVVRPFAANMSLIREGERPGPCFVLLDGFVMRIKWVLSGGRQIVALQLPGDALDLQHLYFETADHNLQSLTAITIAEVPRLAVRRLAEERSAIMKAILIDNQVEASIARTWIANIGRRSAYERIAHLICELAMRMREQIDNDVSFYFPLNQEQLGDATGLTSVHINRMLRNLTDKGLIERNRASFRVRNWKALAEVAGFDPDYLHHRRHVTPPS